MIYEIIGIVLTVIGLGFTLLSGILLPFAFIRFLFSMFAAAGAVNEFLDDPEPSYPEPSYPEPTSKPSKPSKPSKYSKPVVSTYDRKFKLPSNPFA